MLEKEIPKYNLDIDIKSNQFKDNIIEVNTILKLKPNQDIKHKMLTEINITALVAIEGDVKDKNELEKIVLIKVPADLYPTLYETFIYFIIYEHV